MPGAPRIHHQPPRASWLAIGFFWLMIAGCAQPPPSDPLLLDGPPASIFATYQVQVLGNASGTMTVHGFDKKEATSAGGPKFSANLMTISVNLTSPTDGSALGAYDIRLFHVGNGSRVGLVEIECNVKAPAGCGREGFGPGIVSIPEAYDAFGFLGLGPFLGRPIAESTTQTFIVRDVSATRTATFEIGRIQHIEGRRCVEIHGTTPVTDRIPLLVALLNGRLLACEGTALPIELEIGGIRFVLTHYSAAPEPLDPIPWPGPHRPAAQNPGTCDVILPALTPDTLPSTAFIQWAAGNDSYLSEWMKEHPDGQIMPAYGLATSTRNAPVGSTRRDNSVILTMLDPKAGTYEIRSGGVEATSSPLNITPPSYQFIESRSIGVPVRSVPTPIPLSCNDGRIHLEEMSATIRSWFQSNATIHVQTYLSPELGGPWLGSDKPRLPFSLAAPREFGEWTRASPWPVRGYVGLLEDSGGMVGEPRVASFDPATGFVRWAELERPPRA